MKLKNQLYLVSKLFFLFILMAFSAGCEEEYTPKPKGFARFDLPPHEYQRVDSNHPYSFEHSKYAEVTDDTFNLYEPHWLHVYYPKLKAMVHLTYKNADDDKKKFDELVDDAFRLANKHNVKAYSIETRPYTNPNGVGAMIIRLEGDVPSHFQFFITDSTSKFFRAALYFPVATKNDSLKPAVEYVAQDMMRMLDSFEWKNEAK